MYAPSKAAHPAIGGSCWTVTSPSRWEKASNPPWSMASSWRLRWRTGVCARGRRSGWQLSAGSLVWHPPRQGDGQRLDILQSLARLQPAPHPLVDLIGLITARSARDASLILITPNSSGDWLETLLPLLWQGSTPTVLLLDPAAFGSQAEGRPLSQRLAHWGIHHHLITPDLLNRPEAHPGRKGQREFRVTPTGRAIPVNPPREASWRGFS